VQGGGVRTSRDSRGCEAEWDKGGYNEYVGFGKKGEYPGFAGKSGARWSVRANKWAQHNSWGGGLHET